MTDQQSAAVADAVPAELLGLAALHLPNLRAERYFGETAGVPLGSFASPDEEIIRRVYRLLNDLLAILTAATPSEAISSELHAFLQTANFDQLRTDLRTLGRATFASDPPDHITAKAIHDLRGGALAVLLLRLELAGEEPFIKDELRTLFMLVRDHGKIMRSAVIDLDSERRRQDLAPQSHHVRLLTEKWQGAAIGADAEHRAARLFVDCRFDGAVSECCLESAAVDRIMYNLMANARRHNAGERLDLLIFETPGAPGENLRFVLRNAVSEADAARLVELATAAADGEEPPLGALFRAGISTTGSGFGLAIIADLVTQAYNVGSEKEALRLGYFGARLLDGTFTIWFHWPIANEGLGRPIRTDAAEGIPSQLQQPGRSPRAASVI